MARNVLSVERRSPGPFGPYSARGAALRPRRVSAGGDLARPAVIGLARRRSHHLVDEHERLGQLVAGEAGGGRPAPGAWGGGGGGGGRRRRRAAGSASRPWRGWTTATPSLPQRSRGRPATTQSYT